MATQVTGAGGTTTSFSNTPQAKDDLFLLSENDTGVLILNVLANDLGGAAKQLYSIDNAISDPTSTKVPAPADLLTRDATYSGNVGGGTDTSYLGAHIWIGTDGTIHYDTATIDGKIQALGAGEVLTDKVTYAIQLGNGTLSWATATIQFNGTNDKPVITSGTQSASVTEIADLAAGENITTHVKTGAITFSDADTLDTHTATFVAATGNTTALGTFALNTSNIDTGNGGSVGWTFSVSDGALDYLQAGQVVTQSYIVSINDGHGGIVPQTVTVTITGSEDKPVITSGTQSASVTEIADLAAGENITTHVKTGAITFSDADTLDTHTATFVAAAGNTTALGTFALNTSNIDTGNGGSVGWTFSVSDGALDYLQAGQVVTQSYIVSINDGHGGIVPQTVTVTITG
ncbi:VCBS domain-containing protein, partial [Mesorhizobium sp. CO1-1-8]|uniref:VCBS domain-containing protein n=1 Tax=Mesorhizobium sp. CO1-1-8 TaxID=2876631 RepID=UPI001CD117C0